MLDQDTAHALLAIADAARWAPPDAHLVLDAIHGSPTPTTPP